MAVSFTRDSPHSPLSIDAEKLEQNRLWHRLSRWIGREDALPGPEQKIAQDDLEPVKPSFGRRLSRKVVPGLPRPATFRRQNSERREKLTPVNQSDPARRVQSMDRRRAKSARPASPGPVSIPKLSAPALFNPEHGSNHHVDVAHNHNQTPDSASRNPTTNGQPQQQQRPMPPPSPPPEDQIPPPDPPPAEENMDEQISQELEEKWILNLSMHFRDRSPREKFFVTYAEQPARWRRVTVSCDYRDAPPDSLERDLQALQFQRDKSARIYEAIRLSLPDIQFYPTVTNLRLETSDDDRLHVHVTEDVNEIIPYPSTTAVQHLEYKSVPERDVVFDSHMSGFVYRVRVNNADFNDKVCIKKEIPGPDSVEEFLYEINALHSLIDTENVINFEGLVVDEENNLIKGLLISYADQGPLVDLIYDFKGTGELTWQKREKWAREIVAGLSEIHEAGFVQGDFTLSNIVVDENETAQIIDINRRGCPVGWEPPEIDKMISSGQRISMYIGVKSDLFQLGMVLWGLAQEIDEPEKQERPLRASQLTGVPQYYKEIVDICLSEFPKDRKSAKHLLGKFGQGSSNSLQAPTSAPSRFQGTRRPGPQYIDPAAAVELADIARLSDHPHTISQGLSDAPTYVDRRPSIDMPFDGPGSYMVSRGRSPPGNTRHLERNYSGLSIGRMLPDPGDNQGEPQILPISPSAPNRWNHHITENPEWDLMDSEEDDDERERRRARKRERMRSSGASPMRSTFEHVDSGLADMDLVGIGENDMLKPHHNALDMEKEIDSLNGHGEQQNYDQDIDMIGDSDGSTVTTGRENSVFNGAKV